MIALERARQYLENLGLTQAVAVASVLRPHAVQEVTRRRSELEDSLMGKYYRAVHEVSIRLASPKY